MSWGKNTFCLLLNLEALDQIISIHCEKKKFCDDHTRVRPEPLPPKYFLPLRAVFQLRLHPDNFLYLLFALSLRLPAEDLPAKLRKKGMKWFNFREFYQTECEVNPSYVHPLAQLSTELRVSAPFSSGSADFKLWQIIIHRPRLGIFTQWCKGSGFVASRYLTWDIKIMRVHHHRQIVTAPHPIWPQAWVTECETCICNSPKPPINQPHLPWAVRTSIDTDLEQETTKKSLRKRGFNGAICMQIKGQLKL